MRLKNVRGSKETVVESPHTIKSETQYKGKWHEVFQNQNPIHIEIGMGKGKFVTTLAIENPNINYLGIEKFSSVLVRALEKRRTLDIANLYYIRMEAEYISDVFASNEIQRIYLNFSDPWPKDRHAKRRLTSRAFLERYDRILSNDGVLEFKTDNRSLFDFSLAEIRAADWNLMEYTYDLHNDTMNEGNIMTEYEEKFSSSGYPIHKLISNRGIGVRLYEEITAS